MRAGHAGPALGVKGRLGRSSNCSSLLHISPGQSRITLTDALNLSIGSSCSEDLAPAAVFHQITGALKKIEAAAALFGGAGDVTRSCQETTFSSLARTDKISVTSATRFSTALVA